MVRFLYRRIGDRKPVHAWRAVLIGCATCAWGYGKMPNLFHSLDHALQALLATLFTWSVTALGAALVFSFKRINKTLMDAMLGFAAGVMVAASYWSLLAPAIAQAEAMGMNAALVSCAGFLSGGGLLFLGDRLFGARSEDPRESGARRCRMLMFSITLHNIPEGLSVGVAFGALAYGIDGATTRAACMLALGIGLQNFPEGTAVSVPFRREGMSRKKAFFYGQLSGVVEPIACVAGAFLVAANFAVDIIYGLVDPRIRLDGGK